MENHDTGRATVDEAEYGLEGIRKPGLGEEKNLQGIQPKSSGDKDGVNREHGLAG
ncbi:MAG: hypothetical protein HYZ51_01720 [Candidatus Doudnabacteria bacterium]|nr:hypothetical protein [Candidatus Doudnabacteria bacterium]